MGRNLIQCTLLLIPLLTVICSGCTPQSSPPGPSSATGVVDGSGYVLHAWNDGLAILIVHDAPNAFFCQGEGGSSSPIYHLECTAESNDGRSIQWEIETRDGLSAKLSTAGQVFNVNEGTVFILMEDEEDGRSMVHQIARDVSTIPQDNDRIVAFIQADKEIMSYLNGSGEQ